MQLHQHTDQTCGPVVDPNVGCLKGSEVDTSRCGETDTASADHRTFRSDIPSCEDNPARVFHDSKSISDATNPPSSVKSTRRTRADKRWKKRYRNYLKLTDVLIVVIAVAGAQVLKFGSRASDFRVSPDDFGFSTTYTVLSALIVVCWGASLTLSGTRDPRLMGVGIAEYQQVVEATLRLFGVLAIVDLLFKLDLSRGYLLISFPVGLLLLLLSRWLWRKWLHSMRRKGKCLDKAILVGEAKKVSHVTREVSRERAAGYRIVGAVANSLINSQDLAEAEVRIEPSVDVVTEIAEETQADTIIFVGSDHLDPGEIRKLGWIAEEHGLELIVAPALTDIAGPRIHARPVAGLPLIHIDYPEITGFKYWLKRLFDIVVSAFLLLLLSPVFLVVAVTIKVTSPGPVFYKQERIGKDGKPFGMLKFRSMIVDADSQLAALLEAQGTSDKPLFKVEDDPRITGIGKFIRRYSIDELPQLLNAVLGTMSLVGPRPQVAGEVALYDNAAFRRLMVKPGLTGLWQVSGRSNLSWEDAIRLDLYYVENWSLTEDLLILFKTFKAIVGSDGAY